MSLEGSLGTSIAQATMHAVARNGWLDSTDTLITLADGFLHQVPFDVLPLAAGDGVYGDRFVWARSSSVTALEAAWHHPARPPRAAAFAPAGSVGAIEEVGEVLRAVPGRAFLGRRATESDFVREAGWSSLIHFGGHALPDPGDGVGGALALRSKGVSDGHLTRSEIAALDLRGAYVVLLGCDTARRAGPGLGLSGSAVASLSDAFVSAGSRAVIGNLWAVTEATARELAREFYAAGGPALGAASLAAAKRAMRRRFPNQPDRWAGAVWEGVPAAVSPVRTPANGGRATVGEPPAGSP